MNIELRSLTLSDYEVVLNWRNDEDFCSANGWDNNISDERMYEWWSGCVNDVRNDFIRKGIELDGRFVGYVDLAYITGNSAELGIAIGNSGLWGKGIGFTSAKRMIEYASRELGLSSLTAETHETNYRSRKMLEKLGFKEIGRHGCEEYMGITTTLIQFQLDLNLNVLPGDDHP
jgi:[ribosomal protein S5]-alanine N-acetyltransferase